MCLSLVHKIVHVAKDTYLVVRELSANQFVYALKMNKKYKLDLFKLVNVFDKLTKGFSSFNIDLLFESYFVYSTFLSSFVSFNKFIELSFPW